MKLGRIEITASRWPWQGTGWGKVGGWARFGGGWDWKLGVSLGGQTLLLDLIFGLIRISILKPKTS